MRGGPRALPLLALPVLAACAQLDLGDAPFFCNSGSPQCPDGYSCMTQGPDRVCVRTGTGLDVAYQPRQDAQVADDLTAQEQDTSVFAADSTPPISTPTFDSVPPSPDLFPTIPKPPDAWAWPPQPDLGTILPHLGCQSSATCTWPGQNCCCPLSWNPNVWVCAALCVSPACSS